MAQKPIPETISYLIAQTCKAHRGMASKLLTDAGLHVGQETILSCLWQKDGLTQSELAEQLCVQPATVTKMLNRMVQAGLVERQEDVQDQRISRVYLTNRGRDLQETVEEIWGRLELRVITALTLEERILLRRLLMQVHENLHD